MALVYGGSQKYFTKGGKYGENVVTALCGGNRGGHGGGGGRSGRTGGMKNEMMP